MINRYTSFIRKRGHTLQALGKLMVHRSDSLRMLLYVRKRSLTFLGLGALADLALAVNEIEQKAVPGLLVEAGSALGGSSILITSTKNIGRHFQVYDTFEMIPPPTETDGQDAHLRYNTIKAGKASGLNRDPYYGYQGNLYEQVLASFSRAGFTAEQNNVHLVKGLIEDTMQIHQPVALAHIDCDWYSPVRVCLEQIVPNLSAGGRIIIDDYNQWSGARKAVDEYFCHQHDEYIFKHLSRLHIFKRN